MKQTLRYVAVATVMTLVISAGFAGETEKQEKKTTRGWLGVSIENVTKKLAEQYSLKEASGAYVNDVVDDSPADSAGIKEHDVIIEFSKKPIEDADALIESVGGTTPGTKTSIVVVRDGERKNLSVVVGKAKMNKIVIKRSMFPQSFAIPQIHKFFGSNAQGLKLMDLNEQLAEYFGLQDGEGVLVEEVAKKSAAEKAGFKAGDVVVRAGKKNVDESDDVVKEFSKHDEGDKLPVEILRKGAKKTLTLEIEEQENEDFLNLHGSPNMNIFKFRSPGGHPGAGQFQFNEFFHDLNGKEMAPDESECDEDGNCCPGGNAPEHEGQQMKKSGI